MTETHAIGTLRLVAQRQFAERDEVLATLNDLIGACPDCHGTGEVDDPCDVCSRHTIPAGEVCGMCQGIDRTPCPICRRRGEILSQMTTLIVSMRRHGGRDERPADTRRPIGPMGCMTDSKEARQARVDALWSDADKGGNHVILLDPGLGTVEILAWGSPTSGRWGWCAGGRGGGRASEQEAKQAAIDATIARLERMIRTLRGEP